MYRDPFQRPSLPCHVSFVTRSTDTSSVYAQELPEFVNRKNHHLKNEGYFDIGAWVGRLEVKVENQALHHLNRSRHELADKLCQLLVCFRLHTVVIQIDYHGLSGEGFVYDCLRPIAEVCAQLRRKIGDGFND